MARKTKEVVTETATEAPLYAMSPEAREQQAISYAYNLAEKQLRDGTASSAVIVHFLKLGTERDRLERERLESENQLARAKREALQNSAQNEMIYREAIEAMKRYSGNRDEYREPPYQDIYGTFQVKDV